MIDEEKSRLFREGFPGWLCTKPYHKDWRKEYEVCNCQSVSNPCYDRSCIYRGKLTRFPADAGGENGCLRLAQSQSKYAFRNCDGRTIILPQEIIDEIRSG